MSFLLGILSTHPDWLPCVLDSQGEVLRILDPPQPGGWGIGFYNQAEVLRRLTPLERAVPLDFRQLAGDVRSKVLIGHVRRATAGAASMANTHPFRFRDWLFAHSGDIPQFDRLRPQLLQNVPEFLARNVGGETDSEVLFHLVLSHLHGMGALREPDVTVDVACEGVHRAIREMDEAVLQAGGAPPPFALIITNGSIMVAAARAERLCIAQFDRLVDCRNCTADRRERCEIQRSERTDLRAVVVVSCGLPLPARYDLMAEQSLIGIKPDATVEAIPLRPSAVGLTGF